MYLVVTDIENDDINTSKHSEIFMHKTPSIPLGYAMCLIKGDEINQYDSVFVYEITLNTVILIGSFYRGKGK